MTYFSSSEACLLQNVILKNLSVLLWAGTKCWQAQGEAPPFLLGKFIDGVVDINFFLFTYM